MESVVNLKHRLLDIGEGKQLKWKRNRRICSRYRRERCLCVTIYEKDEELNDVKGFFKGATSNSSIGDGSSGGAGNFSMTTTHEKSKMWDETGQDARVDELLAIFGYKVESSDMAEVAQKLK
ncbi:unnamed protein product [Ilex paraguariensis]|uniref:Transcriptional factor DELLA N-terminal domain-containing protein n=1 Tax=Ilex paraguariensis TaxID=185542 RepID=A0ABC8R3V7_9AQUA